MIRRFIKSKSFIFIISILCILIARNIINRYRVCYMPDYEFKKVSIADDYDTIFKYTGLSPAAVREMIEADDFDGIEKLNRLYFKNADYKRDYIFYPLTAEEKITDSITPLAPLKDGDILVTFNTHTLDWRHGHLAIVTDSENDLILEHASVGHTSCITRAYHWGSYPAFAVLRYPDQKKAAEAAEYAKEHLTDIPYSIFAGMITKDKSSEKAVSSSHCSHIVWQAFKAVGVDIDSNGGIIVTPRDVAMSNKLEVVQIFALNPKDYNKRLSK